MLFSSRIGTVALCLLLLLLLSLARSPSQQPARRPAIDVAGCENENSDSEESAITCLVDGAKRPPKRGNTDEDDGSSDEGSESDAPKPSITSNAPHVGPAPVPPSSTQIPHVGTVWNEPRFNGPTTELGTVPNRYLKGPLFSRAGWRDAPVLIGPQEPPNAAVQGLIADWAAAAGGAANRRRRRRRYPNPPPPAKFNEFSDAIPYPDLPPLYDQPWITYGGALDRVDQSPRNTMCAGELAGAFGRPVRTIGAADVATTGQRLNETGGGGDRTSGGSLAASSLSSNDRPLTTCTRAPIAQGNITDWSVLERVVSYFPHATRTFALEATAHNPMAAQAEVATAAARRWYWAMEPDYRTLECPSCTEVDGLHHATLLQGLKRKFPVQLWVELGTPDALDASERDDRLPFLRDPTAPTPKPQPGAPTPPPTPAPFQRVYERIDLEAHSAMQPGLQLMTVPSRCFGLNEREWRWGPVDCSVEAATTTHWPSFQRNSWPLGTRLRDVVGIAFCDENRLNTSAYADPFTSRPAFLAITRRAGNFKAGHEATQSSSPSEEATSSLVTSFVALHLPGPNIQQLWVSLQLLYDGGKDFDGHAVRIVDISSSAAAGGCDLPALVQASRPNAGRRQAVSDVMASVAEAAGHTGLGPLPPPIQGGSGSGALTLSYRPCYPASVPKMILSAMEAHNVDKFMSFWPTTCDVVAARRGCAGAVLGNRLRLPSVAPPVAPTAAPRPLGVAPESNIFALRRRDVASPRVAVCIAGFLRNFAQTRHVIMNRLVFPYRADVYAATWNVAGRTKKTVAIRSRDMVDANWFMAHIADLLGSTTAPADEDLAAMEAARARWDGRSADTPSPSHAPSHPRSVRVVDDTGSANLDQNETTTPPAGGPPFLQRPYPAANVGAAGGQFLLVGAANVRADVVVHDYRGWAGRFALMKESGFPQGGLYFLVAESLKMVARVSSDYDIVIRTRFDVVGAVPLVFIPIWDDASGPTDQKQAARTPAWALDVGSTCEMEGFEWPRFTVVREGAIITHTADTRYKMFGWQYCDWMHIAPFATMMRFAGIFDWIVRESVDSAAQWVEHAWAIRHGAHIQPAMLYLRIFRFSDKKKNSHKTLFG